MSKTNTVINLKILSKVMLGLAHMRLYLLSKNEYLKEYHYRLFTENLEPFEDFYNKGEKIITETNPMPAYIDIPGGPLMRTLRSIKFCAYNNDLDHFKDLIMEAELCVSHMYDINEANNSEWDKDNWEEGFDWENLD